MKFFITGISTEVGKTIASAILTEALEADYWKPIQAGDLDNSDSHKVAKLISNSKTIIHSNAYELQTPMSPHAAAAIDGIQIDIDAIHEPETKNHLVIEGAGGLLVPLNDTDTILDIIQEDYNVVVVSRHYLGSINHSLLTIEALQKRNHKVSVIFNGDAHPTTENIILKKTGITMLGRIKEEKYFDKDLVKQYANSFKKTLLEF